MSGNYINIHEKSLFYEFVNSDFLSSDSPVMVFLHEGLGCSKQWKGFHKEISDILKIPVLAYDRYGYGLSEEINEPRNPDFLEQEASSFLPEIFKKLKIQDHKKILFGHSDGGTIAIIYASLFPENVLGIITEAAHVFIEDITKKGLSATVEIYKNSKLREKLKKHHGKKTDSMFNSWTEVWLSPEMSDWNIEHFIPGIKCPVLAIQGENDNYGTYKQLESIRKKTSDKTQILFIPDCGHIPHHQAKETVKKASIEFINKTILVRK